MTSCLRSFAQPASKRKWGEKAAHCSVHWLGTEHSIWHCLDRRLVVWSMHTQFHLPCLWFRSLCWTILCGTVHRRPGQTSYFSVRSKPKYRDLTSSGDSERILFSRTRHMNESNELINSNNIPRSRMYCTETENDFTTYFEWVAPFVATRKPYNIFSSIVM
jgi:hypothetical protein